MHCGGIMDGLVIVLICLVSNLLGSIAVPCIRVSVDDPLGGFGGLSQKEPVSPARSEPRIAPGQCVSDRYTIQDREVGHALWMIHRQPKGDVTPAIVTRYGKPLVTERTHHLDAVAGHCALG